MLLKHSGTYLLARLVPALLSFAALAIYTRILTPQDYGVYVLVIAGVSLVKAVTFSWLDMALLRILPAHSSDPSKLLSTVLALFLLVALLTGVGGAAAALLWPDPVLAKLILFAVPLLWAHAWFELNLTLAQAQLLPGRYGLMLSARGVVTLGLGSLLVLLGAGASGPLIGFCAGSTAGGVLVAFWEWRHVRPRIDRELAQVLARYGIPLTGTVALVFILDTADRFMISAFLGEASVGPYAAAYDLTAQSLAALMMVVNLAAYPLAVQAYEQGGSTAADRQIRQNGSLLLAISLPATVGLATLSYSISHVLLGPAFADAGAQILPWIAVAMLVGNLRPFLFDLAFQLTQRTGMLMWGPAVAAVVNILLNAWWIPAYGILGAAWATLASYFAALVVCIAVGRRLLPVNLDWPQVARIALASGVMGALMVALPTSATVVGLGLRVLAGMLVYAACALLLNVIDARSHVIAWLRLRAAGHSN